MLPCCLRSRRLCFGNSLSGVGSLCKFVSFLSPPSPPPPSPSLHIITALETAFPSFPLELRSLAQISLRTTCLPLPSDPFVYLGGGEGYTK